MHVASSIEDNNPECNEGAASILPVSACTELQKASFLLKCKAHNNLPEMLDDLMLSCIAAFVASTSFQLCKVQVRQATDQQLQLFIPEKPQCQAPTHLHNILDN